VSVAPHEDGYDVLYVADTNNNLIRRVDVYPPSHPQGGPFTTTVAGTGLFGALDGPALQATFSRPAALAVSGIVSAQSLTLTNASRETLAAARM
jgi:sugar lactone lactonase YvrE